MSKIICDVCGTSFPEESSQCPVCGCIPLGDAQRVADDVSTESETSGYTQVRGGRYAQNNVRRRERSSDREDKPGKILLITAAILILIIIVAVIYIAVEIFTPDKPVDPTEPSSPTYSHVDCTDILVNLNTIAFDKKDATKTLSATPIPANTDDTVTYRSENTAVATVSASGVVTAVGEGTTKIIITCGDVVKECTVMCDFPDPIVGDVTFNDADRDITLSAKGEKWTLYNGTVPKEFVRWRSDDESIAIFKDGVVEAVGGGTTTVYAEFGDQIVSCIVRCAFSGGVVGPVNPDTPTYGIYTQWGDKTTDVSIVVGEVVKLTLKDEAGNKVDVSLVTWTCSGNNVTINGNVITGAVAGTTTVSAVYDGVTYKCIFRVR